MTSESHTFESDSSRSAEYVQTRIKDPEGAFGSEGVRHAVKEMLVAAEIPAKIGEKEFKDINNNEISLFLSKLHEVEDADKAREMADEAFLETLSQYESHPEAAHAFFDMFLSNNWVSPGLIAREALNNISQIDDGLGLRDDLFHAVIFRLAHGTAMMEPLQEIISETVSATDIHQASLCLEFLHTMLEYARDNSSYRAAVPVIAEIIEGAKAAVPDTYFLQARIEDLDKGTRRKDVHTSAVSRGQMRADMEQGSDEARSSIVSRLDKTEAERARDAADVFDYAYMMTPQVRERVELDTGTDLSLLYPQERYYFLQFLKHADASGVEKAREFFAAFSLSGIRAFTILDYDKSYGDELLAFGAEKTEFAQELFQTFAMLLDEVGDLSKSLGIALNGLETLEAMESRALSDQLNEALLRKAKDIVIAAMHAKSHGTEEADVLGALKGMLTGISTLNEFFDNEPRGSFEVIAMPAGQMSQFLYTDISSRQYRMKFNIREKAEEKAQARINFELFFDTDVPNEEMKEVFEQETQWLDNPKRPEPQKKSVFRMGIDLDTFHSEPMLSLDIGRAAITSDKRVATGDKLGNPAQGCFTRVHAYARFF